MNFSDKKPKNNSQYLIGKKIIKDALSNKLPITELFLSEANSELKALAKQNNVRVTMHSLKWFDTQFAKNAYHQGIAASIDIKNLFKTPDSLLKKVKNKEKSLILVLDKIVDPGNFGAILRTALATNVDGVIFKTDNQCPVNTTVIKTSMGAALYLDLVPVANLRYTIKGFQDNGYWSIASCLSDDSKNYKDVNADKILLIIGNEDRGISPLLIKESDYRVKIPIDERIESLNASVAAAVLMFEYRK